MPAANLPFDPIDRAGELWKQHFGEATSMMVATSIMRVQQLVIAQLDAALKPFDITFARYEVLVLLTFSKREALPLSKIGQRLMVHPTSVTNAIDRLEKQELVRRVADDGDRRRTLAELTPAGRRLTKRATKALTAMDFAIASIDEPAQHELYALLRDLRLGAGDFVEE